MHNSRKLPWRRCLSSRHFQVDIWFWLIFLDFPIQVLLTGSFYLSVSIHHMEFWNSDRNSPNSPKFIISAAV